MNSSLLLFSLIAVSLITLLSSFASSSVEASCHNATGSCTPTHFVCANEERIPHAQRCDGVEDCADGTDEYLCEHPRDQPIIDLAPAQRTALTEVACIKCTCLKGSITVSSSGSATWWKIGLLAPRDKTLLTSAPTKQNKPCNPADTTSIRLNVYKKQNKGCRGWVCCFRQDQCVTCGSNSPSLNCYP